MKPGNCNLILIVSCMSLIISLCFFTIAWAFLQPKTVTATETIFEEVLPLDIPDPIIQKEFTHAVGHSTQIVEGISNEELALLCRCVQAEAGNQSELGRKLVCDVILNRVDHPAFPNTIIEVIMQKGQFSVVASGAINNDFDFVTYCACVDELQYRTNVAVLFFRTGHYHKGTTPIIHEGDHYFSTKGE